METMSTPSRNFVGKNKRDLARDIAARSLSKEMPLKFPHYIYIARSNDLPGLLKIGCTRQLICRGRAKGLRGQYKLSHVEMVYAVEFDTPRRAFFVERFVIRRFLNRPGIGSEWIKISLRTLRRAVKEGIAYTKSHKLWHLESHAKPRPRAGSLIIKRKEK